MCWLFTIYVKKPLDEDLGNDKQDLGLVDFVRESRYHLSGLSLLIVARKSLFVKSYEINGHTIGFRPPTQKLELHSK